MSRSTSTPRISSVEPGFFISDAFSQGWQIFKKNWLKIWGILLLPTLVAFLYSAVQTSMQEGILTLVVGIVYMVLQLMLGMGVTRSLIQLARGKEVTWDTFKSPLGQIWRYLLACLLYGLIVVAGFILLIVPGVIWVYKYMYMPYLVIDEDLSPMEAMRKSSQMTKGIKWDLFAFSTAAAIFGYIGLFALVVGLFITLPIAAVAVAIVYNLALTRWQKMAK